MSDFGKVTIVILSFIFVMIALIYFITHHGDLETSVDNLLSEGRYQQAELLVENELSPQQPEYHILKARIYTAEGRYYESLRELQSVIYSSLNDEEKAKLIGELVALAQNAAQRNKFGVARKAYEYILQLDPNYNLGEGFRFLAELYFRSGEFAHSIPYFESYIHFSGVMDSVIDNYVKALYESGEYKRIATLQDSIIEKGNSASRNYLLLSLYHLARDAYDSGNYTETIDLLTRFFDIVNRTERPRYIWEDADLLLADAYTKIGEYEKARKIYETLAVFAETKDKKIAEQRLKELPIQ